jgi:hypothetical protein
MNKNKFTLYRYSFSFPWIRIPNPDLDPQIRIRIHNLINEHNGDVGISTGNYTSLPYIQPDKRQKFSQGKGKY